MSNRGRKRSDTYSKNTRGPVLRFRFKAVILIFIVITAICFVIYMMNINIGGSKEGSYTQTWKEESSVAVTNKKSDTKETETAAVTEAVGESKKKKALNPIQEGKPESEDYLDDCVFVGDSITEGLADYQILPIDNVIAEVGMNIQKINDETMQTAYGEMTVLEALKQADLKNIYIMLGSNGIAWLDINDMVSEYAEFLESVKQELPDANIYIVSIPPVTAERETGEQPIANTDIDAYNQKLLELANKDGSYYIDLNAYLKGSDGKFPSESAADDGMHFVKSTYDEMMKFVLSHVVK